MNEVESNKVNAVSTILSVTRPARPGAWFVLSWLAVVLGCGPDFAWGATFVNTTPISAGSAVAGPTPYPSGITVSQLAGEITSVAVTLVNVTHPNPDDLDVLLVGPDGQTVLLMSDAGGIGNVTNVTVSFAPSSRVLIPDAGPLVAGTFLPSNYDTNENFPNAPAPPYGSKLSQFNGTSPNGLWRLFVLDDVMTANAGGIAGGWRLIINTTNRPPVITLPMSDKTVPMGANVEFKVGVDGTPPFGFQWRFNGNVIVPFGQGNDTLRLPNVQPVQDGVYTVEITNGVRINLAGAVVPIVASNQARLNVIAPLQVVEPLPASIETQPGGSITLSVRAVGGASLRYQWYCNGMVISNATASTYRLTEITPFQAGRYSVVIWNGVESVRSGPTLVRVLYETGPRPKDFFQERPDVSDLNGVVQASNVDATLEANEPQWDEAGAIGRTMWMQITPKDSGIMTVRTRGSAFDTLLSVYTGQTLPTLQLVSQDDDSGGCYTSELRFNAQRGVPYQIQVDGGGDGPRAGGLMLSWNLQITTIKLPVIVRAPGPQVVRPDDDAIFRVVTSATDDSYQWYFAGPPYDKPEIIPGATGPDLVIRKANERDVGFYAVAVRNSFDQVVRSPLVPLQLSDRRYLVRDKIRTRFTPGQLGLASLGSGGTFLPFGLGNSVNNTIPSAGNHSEDDPDPCGSPFTGTLWLGLSATNSGVIQVETTGSAIPTRMAVYKLIGDFTDFSAPAMICDLSSATNGVPCVARFDAKSGTNYTVVVEGYEASGNIRLSAKMGVAPALTNPVKYCAVPEGGSIVLQMPATAWCPVPTCQWRLDGIDLVGATGSTLTLTGFNEKNVGTYSVFVSNFVGTATSDVAVLDLAPQFTLDASWITNSGIRYRIAASNSTPFVIQTATSLAGPWSPVATNPDPCIILYYTNNSPFIDSRRFYRAVPWTP